MADWRSLYPFADHACDIGGYRYHFVDEGSGEQPIVCVHGNPTWSFYYRRIVSEFRGSQRVLAVDHIGCGLSDKPQRYPYTLQQHTQNLIHWLDHLDLEQVVMVVHDWGGAIGLGAALARPERVAKLLILNTGAFPPPYVPLRIAVCRLPWIGSWAIRSLNAFAGTATFMAIDRLPRLEPDVQAGLLYPYGNAHDRVAIDGFVRDIPLTSKHSTFPVLTQLGVNLHKLQAKPARIVWGMKDWCFRPDCLERFAKALPNAAIRRLTDVGHYVMEEAPEEVLEELSLLLQSPVTHSTSSS